MQAHLGKADAFVLESFLEGSRRSEMRFPHAFLSITEGEGNISGSSKRFDSHHYATSAPEGSEDSVAIRATNGGTFSRLGRRLHG